MASRSRWLFVPSLIALAASHAGAQPAPTGAHYLGAPQIGGHGSGGASPTGSYNASVPFDLPPARGGLPVPFSVVYTASTHVGEGGAGWVIPRFYVRRLDTLTRRRPAYMADDGSAPVARADVVLSLGGGPRFVTQVSPGVYRPAIGGQTMELTELPDDTWRLRDGTGREYRFTRLAGLGDESVWYLETIVDVTGTNVVRLEYEVLAPAVAGGLRELRLARISYNTHPTGACSKHTITIRYKLPEPDARVLGYEIRPGAAQPLVRVHVLAGIDVRAAGASCGGEPERLLSYQMFYEPDVDTGLPRLSSVDVFGREGTEEARTVLPIARFEYGSATDGALVRATDAVEVALPGGIAGAVAVSMDWDGRAGLATVQQVLDFTGDGLADFVFASGGRLYIAPNETRFDGVRFGAPRLLFPDGSDIPLGLTRRGEERGDSGRYDDVWIQTIDFNGDGRLDIVDAEHGDEWIVWLNTPGSVTDPAAIVWQQRVIDISFIRDELVGRGMLDAGDPMPVARISSGGDWGSVSSPVPWESYTLWKVADVNGDGYPDIIANTREPRYRYYDAGSYHRSEFSLSTNNQVRVFYNRAGVRLAPSGMFATAPMTLEGADTSCGVETWRVWPRDRVMHCGLVDINGDGLRDYYTDSDRSIALGTGERFAAKVPMVMPPAFGRTVFSDPASDAEAEIPDSIFEDPEAELEFDHDYVDTTLMDLTGDGLPDWVDFQSTGLRVTVGDGTGYDYRAADDDRPPPTIPTAFVGRPSRTERDDYGRQLTTSGFADIDGDGRPDWLVAVDGASAMHVVRIESPAGNAGAHEAGRLVRIRNGHGGATEIKYGSAKGDPYSSHRVPFPEIVVTSVRGAVDDGVSASLGAATEPVRYAYGQASLVYDPYSDRFTFPGYERRVAMRGVAIGHGVIEGTVSRSDSIGPDVATGFRRFALLGRPFNSYVFAGTIPDDPWLYLAADLRPLFPLQRGGGNATYQVVERAGGSLPDCSAYDDPYVEADVALVYPGGTLDPTCTRTGFAYGYNGEQWRGDERPVDGTGNHVTSARVQSVDEFGRPLRIFHYGDRARTDDDVCEERSYAAPSGGNRVYSAVHTVRITDCRATCTNQSCTGGKVFSGVRYIYDDLPEGNVWRGFVTAQVAEVYDTDTGAHLEDLPLFTAQIDSRGVLRARTTRRAMTSPPVTTELGYDPFNLVPVWQRVSATTSLPSFETKTVVDPVTLEPLDLVDDAGVIARQYYDGFGRPTVRSIIRPGELELGLERIEYLGDDGTTPETRGVRTYTVVGEVPVATLWDEDYSAATRAEALLDVFNRPRFADVYLGAEHDGAIVRSGETTYDVLGRASFVADAYVLGTAGTRYGTTYHYRPNGELECAIAGRGPQPLYKSTDAGAGRFPTCYETSYVNHERHVRVWSPDQLDRDAPQFGAYDETRLTALGRVVQKARYLRDEWIDLSRFQHDRLGNLTAVTRFQNPATAANALAWRMTYDSLGRIRTLAEPMAAVRRYSYDWWGNEQRVSWLDGGAERALVSDHDPLGRRTRWRHTSGTSVTREYVYDYDRPSDATPLNAGATNLKGRMAAAYSIGTTGLPLDTVAFGYDVLGRVIREDRLGDEGVRQTIRYDHELDGRLRELTFELENGAIVESANYTYDGLGRMTGIGIVDGDGFDHAAFTALEIDELGRYRRMGYGDDHQVVEVLAYSPIDRRQLLRHTFELPASSRTTYYTEYDAAFRVLQTYETGTARAPHTPTLSTYTYDANGRLASALQRHPVGPTFLLEEYQYDGLGNRTDLIDYLGTGDVVVTPRTDDRDRTCNAYFGRDAELQRELLTGGTISGGTRPTCGYVYDALGNVAQIPGPGGDLRTFRYDGASRIDYMTRGTASATFRYGPLGDVVAVEVDAGSTGDDILQRRDRRYGALVEVTQSTAGGTSARTIERRIPGPTGILLARRSTAGSSDVQTLFWHGDGTSNRFFTDEHGVIIQATDTTPFGDILAESGDYGSSDYTKYLWNGGDQLRPFGVHHLGARLYDPATGRFLQRDPLLIPRGASRTNPYAFAFNDPVNFTDPTGLDPQCPPEDYTCGGGGGNNDGGGGGPSPFDPSRAEPWLRDETPERWGVRGVDTPFEIPTSDVSMFLGFLHNAPGAADAINANPNSVVRFQAWDPEDEIATLVGPMPLGRFHYFEIAPVNANGIRVVTYHGQGDFMAQPGEGWKIFVDGLIWAAGPWVVARVAALGPRLLGLLGGARAVRLPAVTTGELALVRGGATVGGLPNRLPHLLATETAAAARVGAAPIPATVESLSLVANEGTLKWVVTQGGELIISPHTVRGVEISHAVLSGGRPVIAAGHAEVAAGGGQFVGISINASSGHFGPGAVEIGKAAFARFGVVF